MEPSRPALELTTLTDFPLRAQEKLRYCDTDRQGHVNNAVFNTMLETGRVEFLYDPSRPLADDEGSFVIAKLSIDFQAEITWPGVVDIGTRVGRVGSSSVTLEQRLFQGGRVAATATTVIVHVDNVSRKSRPLSAATVAALTALS